MKYLSTAILTAAAVVAANVVYEACPRSGKAVCCKSNLLNLAYLNCFKPDSTPRSARDLERICGEEHADPKCCPVTVTTIGVLCGDAEGFRNGHLHSHWRGRRSDEDTPPNGTESIDSEESDPDAVLESISSLFNESSKSEETNDTFPDNSVSTEETETPGDTEHVLSDTISQSDESGEPERPEDIDDILPDLASLFDETEAGNSPGVENIFVKPSDEAEDIDDILPDIASLFDETEIENSTGVDDGLSADTDEPSRLDTADTSDTDTDDASDTDTEDTAFDGDEFLEDIASLFEEHEISNEDF